jgi:putative addiction module component (TIGR02574 family)
MPPDVSKIADSALHLPLEQRAQLAEQLWESLGDPYLTDQRSDDQALTEAKRRDAEIESGLVKPLSHDDVMKAARDAIS